MPPRYRTFYETRHARTMHDDDIFGGVGGGDGDGDGAHYHNLQQQQHQKPQTVPRQPEQQETKMMPAPPVTAFVDDRNDFLSPAYTRAGAAFQHEGGAS